jgi:cytoskeleton protein RodZ
VTIGNELRGARERLGLSREHISATTKIKLAKIAAVEEDAFDELPAGIYLEGIVAAYAREVGLNVDAFVRRLRAQVQPPPSESLEEIAATREKHEHGAGEAPLSVGRAMLAFASVAVVLVVMSVGIRIFPLPSTAKPQQARVVRTTDSVATAIAPDISDASGREVATRGFDLAEPVTALAPRRVAAPVPVEPPAAPEHPAPAPTQTLAAAAVDGAWNLETRVESSSLRMFEGLRLGFVLELRQRGSLVEGTGRKVSENGVPLDGARRTPITVHGTIDNGRLKLAFGERGALRASTGTFDLLLEDATVLRGSFSSDAARSAGVVQAHRL